MKQVIITRNVIGETNAPFAIMDRPTKEIPKSEFGLAEARFINLINARQSQPWNENARGLQDFGCGIVIVGEHDEHVTTTPNAKWTKREIKWDGHVFVYLDESGQETDELLNDAKMLTLCPDGSMFAWN